MPLSKQGPGCHSVSMGFGDHMSSVQCGQHWVGGGGAHSGGQHWVGSQGPSSRHWATMGSAQPWVVAGALPPSLDSVGLLHPLFLFLPLHPPFQWSSTCRWAGSKVSTNERNPKHILRSHPSCFDQMTGTGSDGGLQSLDWTGGLDHWTDHKNDTITYTPDYSRLYQSHSDNFLCIVNFD